MEPLVYMALGALVALGCSATIRRVRALRRRAIARLRRAAHPRVAARARRRKGGGRR